MNKKTLVLGASTNPNRYAYTAIQSLHQKKIRVEAVGLKEGEVAGTQIHAKMIPFQDIHTVTLYVGPANQESYIDYVISLQPKRVIFNPGTYNEDFIQKLQHKHIQTEVACTLVLLATNQY
jgi:predicted CoA-binding protein